MRPIPTDGSDLRYLAKRPGVVSRLGADSRPGHPRNAAATRSAAKFRDWALL